MAWDEGDHRWWCHLTSMLTSDLVPPFMFQIWRLLDSALVTAGEDISRIVLNWWPCCCSFCLPTGLRYATAHLTHGSRLVLLVEKGFDTYLADSSGRGIVWST